MATMGSENTKSEENKKCVVCYVSQVPGGAAVIGTADSAELTVPLQPVTPR